jgi:hypothetical protein
MERYRGVVPRWLARGCLTSNLPQIQECSSDGVFLFVLLMTPSGRVKSGRPKEMTADVKDRIIPRRSELNREHCSNSGNRRCTCGDFESLSIGSYFQEFATIATEPSSAREWFAFRENVFYFTGAKFNTLYSSSTFQR